MKLLEQYLFAGNVSGVETVLKSDVKAASQPIALPDNATKGHPLHRVCDGVFLEKYSEEIGLELARLFFKYGSSVNPDTQPLSDSPLTAACSLCCDQIALLYIQQGADVNHRGCHGGTALHWAAWCGRDVLVEKLVLLHSNINQLCVDFKSTPLFWAVHGLKFAGQENQYNQVKCAKILIAHGADPSIPNFEGYLPVQLLDERDQELRSLLAREN
jgi:hypothetical protein